MKAIVNCYSLNNCPRSVWGLGFGLCGEKWQMLNIIDKNLRRFLSFFKWFERGKMVFYSSWNLFQFLYVYVLKTGIFYESFGMKSLRHAAVSNFYLQHNLWRQKDFTQQTSGALQVKERRCQLCDCWGTASYPRKWPWNTVQKCLWGMRGSFWLESVWAWKWTALLGWACLLVWGH